MPSYLLKCAPGEDLYVEWSEIVDGITAICKRDDMPDEDPARIARADATGTSSRCGFYSFGSDPLLVLNTSASAITPHELPRDRLLDFARCEAVGDFDGAMALLTPIPEEE